MTMTVTVAMTMTMTMPKMMTMTTQMVRRTTMMWTAQDSVSSALSEVMDEHGIHVFSDDDDHMLDQDSRGGGGGGGGGAAAAAARRSQQDGVRIQPGAYGTVSESEESDDQYLAEEKFLDLLRVKRILPQVRRQLFLASTSGSDCLVLGNAAGSAKSESGRVRERSKGSFPGLDPDQRDRHRSYLVP
eukprot:1130691-Rhodomonas_salina.1